MISILLLAFQYKPVQTWAAKKATAYLSKELNTKIDIKSLYIKPFSSVVLEGLYVLDKQKDTLLSTPKLTVEINGFSIFNSIKERYIDFTSVQLDNGSFYLKKQRDSTTNLQFIIDYFNSGDTTKKASKPWTLNFERIGINNLRFRYKNQLRDTLVKGVNFDDVDVRAFSTVVRNLDLKNHLFKASVYKLTFKEKSGFYLKNLTAKTTVDTNQILLQQLTLQTPNSSLRDHFKMSFNSFSDFSDFERRVSMDADFKNAHLSSKDVAYFTSSLDKTQFELGVNGRIRGKVDNLRATNLLVTAGQSTYVKGNFRLKGLPDWENTFMDMDIEQIATNKKDLDYLVKRFTGSTKQIIPAIVGKFGNVNFSGNFTGLQNDFVAYGTFKTKLGRFDTDINLKIGKNGIPSYSGKLTTNQFALGTLIDNNTLGRTSFTAQVKGSGDDLKNLNIAANAKLKTFQFKGYTYNNVTVNGTFKRKFIDGLLKINDRNIKLSLDGTIDMKPKLPVYDFTANVTNANLNKLKLMKDTITVSTTLDADFSGTNLDNINGNIFLSGTRLVNPRTNYVVDSLYLAASGNGRQRLLEFESDVANGNITGNYSLSTLPDYFKSIVKKYIPSLKTDIKPFKSQDFDFNFKLKEVDPLLAVFMPGLKIPDQGTLIGKFNSADQTATLTGYIKTIQYNKIILHDLIIDENTAAQYLNANISLSKVDLSDSLYVKDVNITNFLNRDSLNFNIKLSDKNATNQLDLYGLVEFGRDTTAKLKLLPSDIILDHEQWKLEEQVRIRLLDGKTQISNFELSNGGQMVTIDGFISDKTDDKLNVMFKQFRMSTLNALTKPSGIALGGALNGEVILSSLLKAPGMDADLNIDTLTMNTTQVGNVKIISNLDNERKKAIVRLNILNRGLETMDIEGAYSLLKDDENALDFDINMNQTEAIIFTPFINKLVSDVKGTISTSIKLTGSLQKPQLNGFVTLNNTGLTVNYLKTPYTLSDRLEVENSVIKINKMVLKDNKKGQGIVNGSVDLNNISNPTLDIQIEATNLLALNTTFKDNHLYYGTAYGSGDFSFTGPIDNMKIDIKAATQTGTVFNIPLNASSTASDYDFIRFVSHNDTTKHESEDLSKKFNGVTLNFDLTADEGTTVKIVTDYGKLEGNGVTRNLKLNINSLGDFEMFGDFLISSGKFEFTAKNFISKNFQVNQGGTIRWTGDPANAEINLNAIYEVRTNIAPLYTAAGFTSPRGNQQVLVQAQLLLTKSLLLPTIDFDFTFPTEPTIKEDVATYLSDNTNRSQQALSIIVRRNFTAGTGGGNLNEQVLSTASDAVSEFAFNQLNSFISQSNIKNIDINIRSFNEASASIRLFSDRLILNGSLFTNTGSNNLFYNNTNLFNANFSNLTKDFEALYRIRKDGNLTARYSYRVLSGTALSTFNPLDVQYVNGIGLVYQRDFDSLGEFLRNIFRRGRRNTAPTTPAPINPTPTQSPTPAVNYKLKDDEDD